MVSRAASWRDVVEKSYEAQQKNWEVMERKYWPLRFFLAEGG